MKKLHRWIVFIAIALVGFSCKHVPFQPRPNTQTDEAYRAGRSPESLKGADDDYFADMDYGLTRDPDAARRELVPYLGPNISGADAVRHIAIGRNNWIVWTAGNDVLWDRLNRDSKGALDLLKTVSNYGSTTRSNRWYYLGLVNEPCYKKNTEPRDDRWGLRLDVRDPNCTADPFENETKYPGVKIGARGKGKVEVGSYYGYGTGIMGLRLFPNPDFDEKAQKAWDPKRYYEDKSYYSRADLIKPYRVGMSCGFCHVGPNPSNPPKDPENPTFANLNSNPGAQYFWIQRIFMFDQDPSSFVWQLFNTSRPGALDTSLVSSDEINNPRTMNAIYNLHARLMLGYKYGAEKLAPGGSGNNKQLNDYAPPLTDVVKSFYDPKTTTAYTTHVLKDGADSVGALGALNRVYLNIGLFSEDWMTHFIPLVGGPITSPIEIAYCRKASNYWNANEMQTPDVALFFLATAKPDSLAKAPGHEQYLADDDLVPRGKQVFAERCARCHSSKLPAKVATDYMKPGCIGPNYLKCWDDYWAYTKTAEFKNEMKEIVNRPDFLDDNYLSTEFRVPVTLMETNACSPLATNAIAGDIWDNFSSQSYKELPAVGTITVHDPYTYEPKPYTMPGGGRGYTRPASLISLWSTAPFMQNNSVGPFMPSGSVEDRMTSFDRSITQMLWPEKRLSNPPGAMFVTKSGKMAPGWIDVTTEPSYLRLTPGYLNWGERVLLKTFSDYYDSENGLVVGPIPKGTPINLLANLNVDPRGFHETKGVVIQMLKALPKHRNPTEDEMRAAFKPLVPDMLRVSKCTDFVVNRGHYFGTDFLPSSEGEGGLSDSDKNALIAYLKRM